LGAMLDQTGTIDFIAELFDQIDAFLQEYERVKGPLHGELERGLVICYLVGVMCCDLEAIWEGLGDAAVFGALRPKAIFQECEYNGGEITARHRARIVEELRRRGWLSLRD